MSEAHSNPPCEFIWPNKTFGVHYEAHLRALCLHRVDREQLDSSLLVREDQEDSQSIKPFQG